MFTKFLLTGATGFLGNTIAWKLYEKGIRCRALVMPGDCHISKLPPETDLFIGDLLDLTSLDTFFRGLPDNVCLIHCAGIVSIASRQNPMVYKVNVEGTKNVLYLAEKYHVERVIYVSSVHALPDKPLGETITEIKIFDENLVKGEYAKSKAIASRLIMQSLDKGLNASIVHPSGMIGPCDWRCGQITNTILSYCNGTLPAGVQGGNNFVDVRDVAEGILNCAENGKTGESYILSGHCATIQTILEQVKKIIHGKKLVYLPLQLVKVIAPIYEKIAVLQKKSPFLTPYSAYALGTNANYSHEKATMAFGYNPRALKDTIEDTVNWLKKANKIATV